MAKYQAAVRKWNESAKKCLKVAVQPQYQFLAFAIVHFLSGQIPVLDQFLTAVAEATGGFQIDSSGTSGQPVDACGVRPAHAAQ